MVISFQDIPETVVPLGVVVLRTVVPLGVVVPDTIGATDVVVTDINEHRFPLLVACKCISLTVCNFW